MQDVEWSRRRREGACASLSCERGHSLVELLVALALLACFLGAVLGMWLAGMKLQDRVERRLCALLLAEDLLAERMPGGPKAGSSLGRSQVSGLHWVRRNLEWVEENEGLAPWVLHSREFLRSFRIEVRVTGGRARARVAWGHRKTSGQLVREGRAS